MPPVVILAAPASRETKNVLGHFAALRWTGRRTDEALLHEVVVIAEHLNRTLPLETAEIYRAEIDALELVLLHRRELIPRRPTTKGEGEETEGDEGQDVDEAPRSRLRKAMCACGFIIRLSMKPTRIRRFAATAAESRSDWPNYRESTER